MKDCEYNNKQILIPYYGKKNLNGRIYSEETIDKMIEMYNSKELPHYGQIGYPDGDNFDVLLSKASHTMENLIKEDGKVFGTLKILDTDEGKLLKDILSSGVFRPRSIGTVDADGYITIQKLIAFDFINAEDDAFKE